MHHGFVRVGPEYDFQIAMQQSPDRGADTP